MRIHLTPKQLRHWRELHPTLYAVMEDVLLFWPVESLYITSIGRTIQQDRDLGASGIHSAGPPWRAIDIGIRNLGAHDYQEIADSLARKVNARWQYDPTRLHLNVIVSKKHGTGAHIHGQVGALTERKGIDENGNGDNNVV